MSLMSQFDNWPYIAADDLLAITIFDVFRCTMNDLNYRNNIIFTATLEFDLLKNIFEGSVDKTD